MLTGFVSRVFVCCFVLALSWQSPLPLSAQRVSARDQIATIQFQEFFAPATNELRASDKLLALQGKRVRITGFMAQMENAPTGYFYLCAQPVFCDESGGGIGELPISAVRIIVPAAKNQLLKFTPHPIVITGILSLGGQSARENDSWAIRILMESQTNFSAQTKAKSHRHKQPKQ